MALDRAVWEHVRGLLSDPPRLLAQFQDFAEDTVAEALSFGHEQVRLADRRGCDGNELPSHLLEARVRMVNVPLL